MEPSDIYQELELFVKDSICLKMGEVVIEDANSVFDWLDERLPDERVTKKIMILVAGMQDYHKLTPKQAIRLWEELRIAYVERKMAKIKAVFGNEKRSNPVIGYKADLQIRVLGNDVEGDSIVCMLANTQAGIAFLKMWCHPNDPPTVSKDGRNFVSCLGDDCITLSQRAQLAGLEVEFE